MSRKMCALALIVLTIALTLIPGVYAEYPIENIDEELLDTMIVGSSYVMNITFDNVAKETVTFIVNVTVTSEILGKPIIGYDEIFIHWIELNGVKLTYTQVTPGVFTTVGATIYASSHNELNVNISTAINLMPGDYTFEIDLLGEEMIEPEPSTPFRPIRNKLPVADAGLDRTVYVGQFVEFSGANSTDPDGTIVSYEWDFSDGAEASGVNVSHRYMMIDDYTVTLTVRDNRYGEDTDTCMITVIEHPIIVPPLPPYLDNLNITPAVIELGDNVTISFDIRNMDSQSITYMVDIQIGYLTFPVDVELEAYEFKTMSHTMFPTAVGVFNVTIIGMIGNFMVEAPEIPLKPAEFVVSDLIITPDEADIEEEVEVNFIITNIGELPGDYWFNLGIEGPLIVVSKEITGSLGAGESQTISYELTQDVPGTYNVEVEDLKDSFVLKTPLKPAEFMFSDLRIFYPGVILPEVEEGETVTVTASVEVKNVGELEGNHTVELKVNEYVVDSQEITLEGGASETVLFELTRGEGTYEVEVEGLTESYTVTSIPEPPFWTQPKYIAVIVIVIIGAGVIIYMLRRRQVVTEEA